MLYMRTLALSSLVTITSVSASRALVQSAEKLKFDVKNCFGGWGVLYLSSELVVTVDRGECGKGVVNNRRSTCSFGNAFWHEFRGRVGYKYPLRTSQA